MGTIITKKQITYVTTDGTEHQERSDATKHQLDLDLRKWFDESKLPEE